MSIHIHRFGASRGGPLPPKKFGNPGERLRKKKWDLNELPKFEKNFYVEHPEVARLTPVSSVLSTTENVSSLKTCPRGFGTACKIELTLH